MSTHPPPRRIESDFLKQCVKHGLVSIFRRSFPHRRINAHLLALSIVITLGACAANQSQISNEPGVDGKPKWVALGSKTLKTKTGRLFHGVGAAQTQGDFARQTSIADQRAKSELEKILNSYVEIVSRDYTAAVKRVDEHFIQQVLVGDVTAITDSNMPAVRIVGHWHDSSTGIVYSIAELNMRHLQTSLNQLPGLDKDFRGYLLAQGESIFDRIARREE